MIGKPIDAIAKSAEAKLRADGFDVECTYSTTQLRGPNSFGLGVKYRNTHSAWVVDSADEASFVAKARQKIAEIDSMTDQERSALT